MSGAMAEVLRLTGVLFDGARTAFDAPALDPLPVASALLVAGVGVALAWRTGETGWPSTDGAIGTPSGWSADGAMQGAASDSPGGVMQLETPGGGE
jgi:hypothetical protein